MYAPAPLPERQLRTSLFFGDERTIEDDPAFSFRLLVDVAIKALSPAVNDPTTAVQCLHRIEDTLRYASSKYLSVGVVTDDQLHARLIFPTPSWDDLVTRADALLADRQDSASAARYRPSTWPDSATHG